MHLYSKFLWISCYIKFDYNTKKNKYINDINLIHNRDVKLM